MAGMILRKTGMALYHIEGVASCSIDNFETVIW